jgi:hypothetical protein
MHQLLLSPADAAAVLLSVTPAPPSRGGWLGWRAVSQMQRHSEYLTQARRTLQRELKEMNAVRVDDDNWHHQVR